MGFLNLLGGSGNRQPADSWDDKENRLPTSEPGKGNFTRPRKVRRGTPRWQIEAYIFLGMVAICALAYAILSDSYEWQHMGHVRRGMGLMQPTKTLIRLHSAGIGVNWAGALAGRRNTRLARGE